jgi:arsenical pump membrane protein
VSRVPDQLASLWPALAFLLAGVPLAALLDRLGLFDAVAVWLGNRSGDRGMPVGALWVLAAATTVALNLDTTVVLLTPLYLRLAKRAATEDPLALAVVPLLLAGFASSVLPVSNLTNLIVADRVHAGVVAFVTHTALPSVAATATGWWAYRRRFPTRLGAVEPAVPDRFALAVGGSVVAGVLVGFVAGPEVGVAPWAVAAAADVVLVGVTRSVPWRTLPVATAVAVAGLGAVVAVVGPASALRATLVHAGPVAVVGIAAAGATLANLVNNLPALLAALDGVHRSSWGLWAWLVGVNVGAVLLPVGALANLLWLRLLRRSGVAVGLRRYVAVVAPIAVPAMAAAVLTLVAERVAAA